jgi:glycosyltransferase involved in cell wall biosynthesis
MKVLILATDIYTRGGIARYTYTFASALADLLGPGNVDVLALLAYGDASDLHPRFRILGPVSEQLTLGAKIRFVIKALALARKRYDLIVCSHLGLAPVAAAIRFIYRTPFWVACHGTEAWSPLPLLKRFGLRQSTLLLPISRFTAEKLLEVQRIPKERLAILHNAITNDFAALLTAPTVAGARQAGVLADARILLSVGSVTIAHAYKGFDTVIRALPKVLGPSPNAHYVIVGQGDARPDLERLAADVGVADRVTFRGEVSDAELAALYRTCEVFVMPSRALGADGAVRGEGFGRVYAEAALAGKPVVGSCMGGAAEAVLDGKTGFLVNPGSVDEVAHAVIALLSDKQLAASMGAAGREWAQENFTQTGLRRRLAQLLGARFGGEACRS